MLSLNENDIDKKAVNSKDKILVMFRADWCPFCQKFRPVFESYEGKAKVKFAEALVNDEENPMWDRFRVEAIPTLVAFQNGKEIARRDAKRGVGLDKTILESVLKELNAI